MGVETGSRNDVQEVSEVQRIEPFFLASIIYEVSLSIPGRIAMQRSSGSRVLGFSGALACFDARLADEAYSQVQKGGAQITLLVNWSKTREELQ